MKKDNKPKLTFNLDDLKVQSFVTELDERKLTLIQGAGGKGGGITPQDDNCPDFNTGDSTGQVSCLSNPSWSC